MKQDNNGKTVTFKDLWDLLVRKILVIAVGACIGTALLFVVNQVTYSPRYESRAILYITRQGETASFGDASSEFSLSLKLVNDCTYFLKSHTVLDQVIENLDLELSYRQLHNSITVSNPENTRVLEIIVEADSPELAKQIVDQICSIAPQEIKEVMGYEQVQQFEAGTLNTEPCNKNGMIVYLLAFAVLAAAIYGVFLVIDLLDDRIRSDEDIEQILGLSILGSIPDVADTHRERYGHYGNRNVQKKGDRV